MNSYKLSIVGDPLGDDATGVIKAVKWKLEATDGTSVAFQADIVYLPPIDPTSPTFIPLAEITIPVLEQWAKVLLNLPHLIGRLDAELAEKSAPVLVPLQLALDVIDAATTGVDIELVMAERPVL